MHATSNKTSPIVQWPWLKRCDHAEGNCQTQAEAVIGPQPEPFHTIGEHWLVIIRQISYYISHLGAIRATSRQHNYHVAHKILKAILQPN